MHATTRRRPAGFTLIELLVVISILGVLAAIGTGAYFRIRSNQQLKATEDTVTKLEAGFQSLWKAEVDEARDAFKGKKPGFTAQVDAVKTLADNDQDRALALWTYIWMKRAFPQNFAQATATTTIAAGVTLPPLPMFSAPTFTTLAAPANTAADEAAVILYRILTQKSSRGQSFNEEAIGALSTPLPRDNATGQKVFTDTFGSPVTFVRLCKGTGKAGLTPPGGPDQGDLNGPPYTKGAGTNNDPLDPAGRLNSTTSTVWTGNLPTALFLAGRRSPAPPATPVVLGSFDAANWLPTLVARTSAEDWGTLAGPTVETDGLILVPEGFTCGYKLRRLGARGDQ